MSDSATPWTVTLHIALLCSWNSLGKSTGVGCHALLQEIFPAQGLNPGLLHRRQIQRICWATREAPVNALLILKINKCLRNLKTKGRKEGGRQGGKEEGRSDYRKIAPAKFSWKKICITQSNHAEETEDVEGSMQSTSRKFKIHSITNNGKSL